MSKDVKVTYELHPKQYDAYHFTKKYGATICGKRSGKTFVGALWVGKQINDSATPVKGLIIAPTYKILDQAALDTLFGVFPEWKQYYKQQQRVIELPRGDVIYCRSAEEPNSIEGLTLNFIWSDEAGQMKRDIWRIMRARVSTTKGQIFITTSPYTMNWCYHDLYKPWKDGLDPDVDVFMWKTEENPVFKNDAENMRFLEQERRRLSPEEYAREYDGLFTHLQGLIWDIPEQQVLGDSPMLQRIMQFPDRVIGGIDWGFHNASAVSIAFIKDATYYIVDEWKEKGKTTPEIIAEAKRFQKLYNVAVWFPDPAEPDRIEEMKRAGLHVGSTNKDVPLGLSYVSSLIREQRLFVHERCKEFLDEASQYVFEKNADEKENRESPVKFNDHICDSVRYLCMGYRPLEPRVNRGPIIVPKANVVTALLNRKAMQQRQSITIKRSAE